MFNYKTVLYANTQTYTRMFSPLDVWHTWLIRYRAIQSTVRPVNSYQVNSYPSNLVPTVNSYPSQLVPTVNSYTSHVVPKVNSYPKTKETQRNDIGRSQIMIGITHVRTGDGTAGGGCAGRTECVIGLAVVAFRPENCVCNSLSQLIKINL